MANDAVLTWSGYDGVLRQTSENSFITPEDAVYSLNGDPLGKGMVGLVEAVNKAYETKPASICIEFPETSQIESPDFAPPFNKVPIMLFLCEKKIPVTYYYRGRRMDIRTVWWDIEPGVAGGMPSTEFYLDGKSIGKNEEGLRKLGDIRWGYKPVLQVMMFGEKSPPYRTHVPDRLRISAVFPEKSAIPSDLLDELQKKGVRIESYCPPTPLEW